MKFYIMSDLNFSWAFIIWNTIEHHLYKHLYNITKNVCYNYNININKKLNSLSIK